ncbi:hypothetical protein [Halogranum amylolyticum]|uniref:hypothetical protein n=1 Tax=Halogranum amylolyticum TaxID=660520 RepID=UPI00373FDB0F
MNPLENCWLQLKTARANRLFTTLPKVQRYRNSPHRRYITIYDDLYKERRGSLQSTLHSWISIRSGSPALPHTGHVTSGVEGSFSHDFNAACRCAWTSGFSVRESACDRCICSSSRALIGPSPCVSHPSATQAARVGRRKSTPALGRRIHATLREYVH